MFIQFPKIREKMINSLHQGSFNLYLRSIIAIGVAVIWISEVNRIPLTHNAFSIEVVSPKYPDTYQVFYDRGRGFNEVDSLRTTIQPADQTVTLNFFAFPIQPIKTFRIAPGAHADTFGVAAIRLEHEFRRIGYRIRLYEWTGAQILKEFQPVSQINEFRDEDDRVYLTATGNDPQFQYTGNWQIVEQAIAKRVLRIKLFFAMIGITIAGGIFCAANFIWGMIKTHYWWSFVGLALIKLWLVVAQQVWAIAGAKYDDLLYIELSRNIITGKWLGPYNQLTLVKGPFYAILIALTFYSGWSLLFVKHVTYLLAIAFIINILRHQKISHALLVMSTVVFIFNPVTFCTGSLRVYRDSIADTVTLFVFAGILGLLLAFKNRQKILIWLIIFGVTLVPFWLLREEGAWILPAIACADLFMILFVFQHRQKVRVVKYVLGLLIPFGILVMGVSLVKWLNYREYGVGVISEFKADYFQAAYGALTRVRHKNWRRYAQVPQDVRQKIYTVSPAFDELESYLENPNSIRAWTRHTVLPDDYSSHFIWIFREAVASVGYHKSAVAARDYYWRLANEINTACEDGRLDCYPKRQTLMPVFHKEYVGLTLQQFWLRVKFVSTARVRLWNIPPKNSGNVGQLRLFEEMTNTSGLTEQEEFQRISRKPLAEKRDQVKLLILQSILKGYQFITPILVMIAFLCFGWSCTKNVRTGFSPLFAFNLTLLIAICANLFGLSYVDATAFSTGVEEKLAPAFALLCLFICISFCNLIDTADKPEEEKNN